MRKRFSAWVLLIVVLFWLTGPAPGARTAPKLEPIVYTIKVPSPDTHVAEVEARVPTGKRAEIDLMMAVWSPGFYRVENYSGHVQDLSARLPNGAALPVEQYIKNRWRIR